MQQASWWALCKLWAASFLVIAALWEDEGHLKSQRKLVAELELHSFSLGLRGTSSHLWPLWRLES